MTKREHAVSYSFSLSGHDDWPGSHASTINLLTLPVPAAAMPIDTTPVITGNSSDAFHTIWEEGYLVTGMEGIPAPAKIIGVVQAPTFQAACDTLCSPPEWQERNGNYDSTRLTVWGCRLFDNEADARRAFG